jgi:hypothetical protein
MTVDHRASDDDSCGGFVMRKLNTAMSHFVSFFAAMNRPSRYQPVGQYNSSTTHEERIGLY